MSDNANNAEDEPKPQIVVVEKEDDTNISTVTVEKSASVQRLHFSFLFRVRSKQTTATPEELKKTFQKYVRDVFIILAIVMGTAIIISCCFEFTNVRDKLMYNRDYFIVIGIFVLILPVISFIVRELTGIKTRNILRWIFMVLSHSLFVLVMAGLACVDGTKDLVIALLVFITITFLAIILFSFQNKFIYTIFHGILIVFSVNILATIIVTPFVWYEAGSVQGQGMIGACVMSTFFCLFALYDVIRLSDYDDSLCLNDVRKPKVRDFVWDSVQVFLEFSILCIFIGVFFVLLILALIFLSIIVSDDGPMKETNKTTAVKKTVT